MMLLGQFGKIYSAPFLRNCHIIKQSHNKSSVNIFFQIISYSRSLSVTFCNHKKDQLRMIFICCTITSNTHWHWASKEGEAIHLRQGSENFVSLDRSGAEPQIAQSLNVQICHSRSLVWVLEKVSWKGVQLLCWPHGSWQASFPHRQQSTQSGFETQDRCHHTLLDKVMSRNQWHIGVQEHHLMFKDLYMVIKRWCVWNKTFLLCAIVWNKVISCFISPLFILLLYTSNDHKS